jgi:hypothetical protein
MPAGPPGECDTDYAHEAESNLLKSLRWDTRSIAFRRAFVQFWMNIDGSDQQPLFSAEVLDSLALQYHGIDERMLSWGK